MTEEIDWIARSEQVEHLSDLVLRLTTLAVTGALNAADLAHIADIIAAAKSWSRERRTAEIAQLTAQLAHTNRQTLTT